MASRAIVMNQEQQRLLQVLLVTLLWNQNRRRFLHTFTALRITTTVI
jgi:hypothetical protein